MPSIFELLGKLQEVTAWSYIFWTLLFINWSTV